MFIENEETKLINSSRDYRDLIAGGLLLVVGLSSAWYAGINYSVGTPDRMGPGMFPVALGYLLAALGVLIAIPAWFRRGPMPKPEWLPMLMVLISVCVFAFTIERLGLVPGTFALTGIAVFADRKMGFRGTLVLGAVLAFGTFSVLAWVLGAGAVVTAK
jgi:hypothetical protein